MDELIKLLDSNLKYISHHIDKDIMYIKVESNRQELSCPFCNTPSAKVHSRYERSFQDLPIQGYKVMLILANKKFLCLNSDCSHTTFAETFSFIKHKAKRTIRLEDEIVKLATHVSSVAASKLLKNQIADVSKSTICNLLKKEIPLMNKSKITKVCIDDFAIKKCERYGTIMIDMDTHKIVDMIESRELNDVTNWLKTFPNIKIVSRDGSLTYKNAITKSHPTAIQVSDRFHLLKNLTSYCKEYLKKHLKTKVVVSEEVILSQSNEIEKIHHKNYTISEKYKCIISEIKSGMAKSQACKEYHLDIRVFNKLNVLSESERENYLETKLETKQIDKATQKMELVNEVRASYKKQGSMRAVSTLLNISRSTVKRYLNKEYSSVHGNLGVKRRSILDPYIEIIDQQIAIGSTSKVIEEIIREKGYKGSSSSIRQYRATLKKTFVKSDLERVKTKVVTVDRKKLFKLLFHSTDKISGLTEEIVESIYKRQPMFKKIILMVESFRILLKDKKINAFEHWLRDALELKIAEINSFVNGICRDLNVVKNAIIYDYNNGLAEGKVNKLKVTKRIMYGRNSFKLLKNKLLRLEV